MTRPLAIFKQAVSAIKVVILFCVFCIAAIPLFIFSKDAVPKKGIFP